MKSTCESAKACSERHWWGSLWALAVSCRKGQQRSDIGFSLLVMSLIEPIQDVLYPWALFILEGSRLAIMESGYTPWVGLGAIPSSSPEHKSCTLLVHPLLVQLSVLQFVLFTGITDQSSFIALIFAHFSRSMMAVVLSSASAMITSHLSTPLTSRETGSRTLVGYLVWFSGDI